MLLLADGILGVIASSHYGAGVWRCVKHREKGKRLLTLMVT